MCIFHRQIRTYFLYTKVLVHLELQINLDKKHFIYTLQCYRTELQNLSKYYLISNIATGVYMIFLCSRNRRRTTMSRLRVPPDLSRFRHSHRGSGSLVHLHGTFEPNCKHLPTNGIKIKNRKRLRTKQSLHLF